MTRFGNVMTLQILLLTSCEIWSHSRCESPTPSFSSSPYAMLRLQSEEGVWPVSTGRWMENRLLSCSAANPVTLDLQKS